MQCEQQQQQKYDVFANLQKNLREGPMIYQGKVVVWSVQPKQVGKQNVIGKAAKVAKRHRILRGRRGRREKYPDLELVWRLVPLDQLVQPELRNEE